MTSQSTMDAIKSRMRATELTELVGDETSAFWLKLAELAAEKVGMTITNEVATSAPNDDMTDEQARAFERQEMPFGARKGEPIYDIDTRYLCNLTDPSPFLKSLKRYVRWRCKHEGDSE